MNSNNTNTPLNDIPSKYFLNNNERLDDLENSNLKIIQNTDNFCFGMDAVLLAGFVKAKKNSEILDLCTGNGIVPILLSAKTKANKIFGVEIQKSSYNLCLRNVELNSLEHKLSFYNADLKDFSLTKDVDVITVNPPYMSNTGVLNKNDEKTIARHEILVNINDVMCCVNRNLKYGGDFYMVHRPDRLVDIFVAMRQNNIEPKLIRFVKSFSHSNPSMVLIKGQKAGKPSLTYEKDLIIYSDVNVYTNEILENFYY